MWRRREGTVVKVRSRREIYGLFTTAELDVSPLVCLVGSSEAGPAYIKPGGDILSSEHAHSHHAQTHRSKPLAARRPTPTPSRRHYSAHARRSRCQKLSACPQARLYWVIPEKHSPAS